MITPIFSQRNFEPMPAQPEVRWEVESCRWALPGGPDTAVLKAASNEWAGRDGRELLRCPVELLDENSLPVWWGYVAGVEQDGLCLSLDGLYNRVRVDYRFSPGGDPFHAYADDLISQEQYGQKELFFDLGVVDHTARVEALAQSWLERTSRPAASWRTGSGDGLRLRLHGWWHTFGWRFRLWNWEGRRSYETEPEDVLNIGSSSALVRGAQGFSGPASLPEWTVSRVRVNLCKIGSPSDFLHLSIQSDSGGDPSGVELDGIDIPTIGLTTSQAWYEYELPGLSAALQIGQRYHMVFNRTGVVNSTNYYRVGLATPYPTTGTLYFKYWNGSAWVQRSPNSIAVHTLWGVTDSGRMIEAMAGTEGGGQLLIGVDIPTEDGRWTSAAQEKVRTYRQEITDLLGLGGANGRWTALVTPGRGLRVFAYPPETEVHVLVQPDGSLTGLDGTPLPLHRVPLGMWARRAALPSTAPVPVERARLEDGWVKMG